MGPNQNLKLHDMKTTFHGRQPSLLGAYFPEVFREIGAYFPKVVKMAMLQKSHMC